MYRDDPLDDEMELRELLGDESVNGLEGDDVEAALDALRVLQGWAEETEVVSWFGSRQRRLGDRTPLVALADGDHDDVLDAARRWAAARG